MYSLNMVNYPMFSLLLITWIFVQKRGSFWITFTVWDVNQHKRMFTRHKMERITAREGSAGFFLMNWRYSLSSLSQTLGSRYTSWMVEARLVTVTVRPSSTVISADQWFRKDHCSIIVTLLDSFRTFHIFSEGLEVHCKSFPEGRVTECDPALLGEKSVLKLIHEVLKSVFLLLLSDILGELDNGPWLEDKL